MIEETGQTGDVVELFDAVTPGENVLSVGQDTSIDQPLYERGHRLRSSDIGLLKATGNYTVTVFDAPTVGVIPTGEELVERDPQPGETVETNGLSIARYIRRWGSRATFRNVVTDTPAALRAAVERDLTKDVIVTIGGTSSGDRVPIPEVVQEIGEILLHGIAASPGHSLAIGRINQTPVVMLPGTPVACIINAVQFLRPLLSHLEGTTSAPLPTRRATLERKVTSEPGVRTFARVKLTDQANGVTATPAGVAAPNMLSSVALADGWVVVPEGLEGYNQGSKVSVENWEYHV
jgi:molybdopterin molybdotransferase